MIYLLPDWTSLKTFPKYFGVLCSYRRNSPGVFEGRIWGMDNDCFTGNFNFERMCRRLETYKDYHKNCRFIVLPDVVWDAWNTLRLYDKWVVNYKKLGLPIAYVIQDGQENLPLPEFDALFVGGSDNFKCSRKSLAIIDECKKKGKWVHMGRVNTWRRIKWCYEHGVDSADGTCVAYMRDVKLKDLRMWMETLPKLEDQYVLFKKNH